MSVHSELNVISHSFSGDDHAEVNMRSGERDAGGAIMFDLVARVQSAEDDIIEAEEEQVRAIAKRSFTKLLKLYLKKILSVEELKFISTYLRTGETPYKIGRAMGLDYYTVIESIQAKNAANRDKLQRLMRRCGYDFRRGLVFLPGLERYFNKHINYSNYRAAHKEEINARQRAYQKVHRERKNERNRFYRAANKEEINAKQRAYYAAHREEIGAQKHAYRAAHKEELNARERAYWAAHKEEINERRRARRAAKKAERTT